MAPTDPYEPDGDTYETSNDEYFGRGIPDYQEEVEEMASHEGNTQSKTEPEVTVSVKDQATLERLKKLGMRKAASVVVTEAQKLEKQKVAFRRLTLAYEHFRHMEQADLDKYNAALKRKTLKTTGRKGVDLVEHYDQVKFTPLAEYSKVPPVDVLDKVEQAMEKGCFDSYEVAEIKGTKEYKDPIVFGRISGCPDRFFIAQWDNDLRIEDIIGTVEDVNI